MIAALALAAAIVVPLEASCTPPSTCVMYQQTLVYNTVGSQQRLSVTACPTDLAAHVVEWEVEAHKFPPRDISLPAVTYKIPEATCPSFVVVFPKAGLWYVRLRTCFNDTQPRQCSRWVLTYDPVDADPVKFPRGFIFNIQLPPATGVGV